MSTDGLRYTRKYRHTENTDAVIRRAYSSEHYQRRAVKSATESLGFPRHIIYRRAIEIGCIQPTRKEPPWTEQEEELLDQLAHLCAEVISRKFREAGFSRSPTAISIRRKRVGVFLAQARIDAGFYSCRQLAVVFGVNSKVISRWIESGWLKAKRAGTARTEAQHGDHWEIREADVRQFIINYTAHVDFRKVDKYWMVDLLAPGGIKKAANEAA